MSTRSEDKSQSGVIWLALTLAVALLPAAGQGQTVEWARSAGGTAYDEGNGVAADAAGNSYVTGVFRETATFGSFTFTSAGEREIYVVKYDANGNVLWARAAGGTDADSGRGIAVDTDGNSYVTGFFSGTATFGPFILSSAGGPDVFVAKYDGSGNVLWAKSAAGTSGDLGEGIAVDASGNSYVTGYFLNPATFGSFTLTSAGGNDIFVAKYDGDGNVLWAQSAGGTSGDDGLGIAVDTAGNTYVTGFYQGTATFGSFMLTSAGSTDIFVAKYDAFGSVLWVRSAGVTSFDKGSGIAVDTAGNSYVTGDFKYLATFGSFTLTSAGGLDVFVAKYDGSGNVLWARSCGGTLVDNGNGIGVDDVGNSYVTGDYEGTATFGPFTLTGGRSFVAKYSAAGNVLWATSTGARSAGIAVAAGNSYATGSYGNEATFCPFMLSSAGSSDIFVAKYVLFPECGNGSIDPCEECDGGLGCTDCLCDADFDPTVPPSLDCQAICGNGSVDPGEECDGTDDSACPGVCLSDCTCGPFCGDNMVNQPTERCDGTDDGWCPGNCLGDCTCAPGTIIPAVSEWGVVVMALLVLAVGTVVVRRRVSTITLS